LPSGTPGIGISVRADNARLKAGDTVTLTDMPDYQQEDYEVAKFVDRMMKVADKRFTLLARGGGHVHGPPCTWTRPC
jgi:hypothetical protein